MKSNVKRLFAGPYILWMIGFTIIPLLLIVYYGLTTKSGAFTLANVCCHHDTGAYEGAAAYPWVCLWSATVHLPAFVLSAGFGAAPPRQFGQAASWYSSSSFRCG